jgi:hypothetical protein
MAANPVVVSAPQSKIHRQGISRFPRPPEPPGVWFNPGGRATGCQLLGLWIAVKRLPADLTASEGVKAAPNDALRCTQATVGQGDVLRMGS